MSLMKKITFSEVVLTEAAVAEWAGIVQRMTAALSAAGGPLEQTQDFSEPTLLRGGSLQISVCGSEEYDVGLCIPPEQWKLKKPVVPANEGKECRVDLSDVVLTEAAVAAWAELAQRLTAVLSAASGLHPKSSNESAPAFDNGWELRFFENCGDLLVLLKSPEGCEVEFGVLRGQWQWKRLPTVSN